MTAGKGQPAPPPVEPLTLAAADLRAAAAELRDVAANLSTELAEARAERAQHADRISDLERRVRDRDKAMKVLRVIAGIDPSPAAATNSSKETTDA
jgi:hypothetical protein